jgi:uncharacterized protein (TIGR02453 family)
MRELRDNNNRDWFDLNRKRYHVAKEDLEQFVTDVINRLGHFDGSIAMQTPKDCMFRINRDIRFAKDKSPYKTCLSFSINKGGKKDQGASYYVQIEPDGRSFIAGGLYMPMPPALKQVRTEIAYAPDEFIQIVENEEFIHYFNKVEIPGHKAVKVPNGFDANNVAADYLKLKGYIAAHPVDDSFFTTQNAAENVAKVLAKTKPLIQFINRAFEVLD